MNKITILIPCFNKQKYLSRLFKSLENQVDPNFNVILLDDNSSDNSLSMIEKFIANKSNYQVIKLSKNKGVANARNILIDSCQSKYFYFLDADDLISKKTIYYLNKAIQENDYQIVYSRFSLIFYKLPVINFLSRIAKVKFKNHIDFISNSSPFIWNKLILKKWYQEENIKFTTGYDFEDTYVTFMLFLSAKNTYFVNKKLYKYDLNLSGISKKQSVNKIEGLSENLNILYSEIKKKNLSFIWNNEVEEFFFKNIMIHLFFGNNKNVIIKNKQEYQLAFEKLLKTFEEHNLESKMAKYKNKFNLFLYLAIKNYFQLKQIFSK
ncbi:Chondroitin polymerase [Mesomycoplasma conjunctivae]|nr:Chondroitin polymerase [Mesomycoplasma conjunctivae]